MALNVNSKVKDLLANPECVKVLEKYMPGMTTNPGLKAAYGMRLKALLAFPQTKCNKEAAAAIAKEIEDLGV